MLQHAFLAVAAAATLATAKPTHGAATPASVKCPIIFDGRVPASMTLDDFDSSNALFGAGYVKGNDLQWSDILLFPTVSTPSRFDANGTKALEVTLSDKSIFQKQNGFRRAGLQFASDSNTGSKGTQGVVTLHFSVMQDPQRKLNLTHEYLNVWHESSDYSADQIMFQTGTLIDQKSLPKNTFKILNRQNKQLWSTPMDDTAWQNFALTLDYSKNTVQIYYSKGGDPLVSQGKAVSADLSGEGQYQIGILKKPTGTSDVVNSGYQERNLNEGQIYGGIFLEDSTGGCVSL